LKVALLRPGNVTGDIATGDWIGRKRCARFTMHKKQVQSLARLHGYWLARRVRRPCAGRWCGGAIDLSQIEANLVQADDGIPFYRERFRQAGFLIRGAISNPPPI
jgi:hypothetical protein